MATQQVINSAYLRIPAIHSTFLQARQNASFANVAANSIATANIVRSGTHYAYALYCEDSSGAAVSVSTLKTQITNLVIRVDGEQYIELSPTVLFDLQLFYGAAHGVSNEAGVLWIPLARYDLFNPSFAAGFAWGTQDVQDITIESTMAATLTGGLSGGKITPYVFKSAEQRPMGMHVRINKYPRSVASTGDYEEANIPRGANTAMLAMHVTEGSGAIKTVEVKRNSNVLFEKVPAAVNKVNLRNAGRSPQSGYYHVAFDCNNDLDGYVDLTQASEFRQTINFSTAPSDFNIYTETVHNVAMAQ